MSASCPSHFTPRERTPDPLDRRLDGPQSQSGHGGEEKNSEPLPGLEPPIIQPVAQCCTTELSWLLLHLYSACTYYSHSTFRGSFEILPFSFWCALHVTTQMPSTLSFGKSETRKVVFSTNVISSYYVYTSVCYFLIRNEMGYCCLKNTVV
jgi:hypothetical protein